MTKVTSLHKEPSPKISVVSIKPPKFEVAKIKIVGVSPLMMNKMSKRNIDNMRAGMEEGSRGKKGKLREAKDFDAEWKEAIHVSTEGWYGFPAGAFRAAMVSACKTVGFAMTRAKLSVFVEADGFDAQDGQPLVKIEGTPERVDMVTRIQNTTNLIARPLWREWSAVLTLRWDADQFSADDVINLLARVGAQVGIGAGRHDSRTSTGLGYGCFEVKS